MIAVNLLGFSNLNDFLSAMIDFICKSYSNKWLLSCMASVVQSLWSKGTSYRSRDWNWIIF